MRALVLTSNFRNADNWLELFIRLNEGEGSSCELVGLRWTGDASAERFDELAQKLPVRFLRDISGLSLEGISEQQLETVLEEVCTQEIDVLFICDMQSYPSRSVYGLLTGRPSRPLVIGLQHGLYQSWWLYNQNFCSDFLLCFGERHLRELHPKHRDKSFAVGLPKLDRLKNVATSDRGYVLCIAQKNPEAALYETLLRQLREQTGLSVYVKDHPQFPDRVQSPDFDHNGRESGRADYIQVLAHASWIFTSYSTGGIEALYLRKKLVLIPSMGITAWAGYPAIAINTSSAEVLSALARAETEAETIDRYLDDTVGGRRFDHTDRAWDAVWQIFRRHRAAVGHLRAVDPPLPTKPCLDSAPTFFRRWLGKAKLM